MYKLEISLNKASLNHNVFYSEIPPAVVLGVPAMVMAPMAKGDNNCNTDFIEVSALKEQLFFENSYTNDVYFFQIAGGQLEATAKVLNVPVAGQTRFCGRAFGIDGSAVNQVICCKNFFKWRFKTFSS